MKNTSTLLIFTIFTLNSSLCIASNSKSTTSDKNIDFTSEVIVAPAFTDCPLDISINLDDACQITFSLIAPNIVDIDGAEASGVKVTYNTSTGSGEETLSYAAGASADYQYSGAGQVTFEWMAIDDFGVSSSCFTQVTLEDDTAPALDDDPPNSFTILERIKISILFSQYSQYFSNPSCS